MNAIQRRILFAAALAVLAMSVFPPFHDVLNGTEAHLGYFPIFSPPRANEGIFYPVNAGLLMVQWLGVLIVAGLLCLLSRN